MQVVKSSGDEDVHPPQQVLLRNDIVQVELIEQLSLIPILSPHHPRISCPPPGISVRGLLQPFFDSIGQTRSQATGRDCAARGSRPAMPEATWCPSFDHLVARASKLCETSRPSTFAVLRLMISSYWSEPAPVDQPRFRLAVCDRRSRPHDETDQENPAHKTSDRQRQAKTGCYRQRAVGAEPPAQ